MRLHSESMAGSRNVLVVHATLTRVRSLVSSIRASQIARMSSKMCSTLCMVIGDGVGRKWRIAWWRLKTHAKR